MQTRDKALPKRVDVGHECKGDISTVTPGRGRLVALVDHCSALVEDAFFLARTKLGAFQENTALESKEADNEGSGIGGLKRLRPLWR